MLEFAVYIPWIAALGALLCGALCVAPSLRNWAGPICVLSIAAGFVLTVLAFTNPGTFPYEDDHGTEHARHAPWQTEDSDKDHDGHTEDAHDDTSHADDHATGRVRRTA